MPAWIAAPSATTSSGLIEQYLSHCSGLGLYSKIVKPDFLDHDNLQLCIEASEGIIDPLLLERLVRQRLDDTPNVRIHFNSRFDQGMNSGYDYVINCSYANINSIHAEDFMKDYQFEVVEKPVIILPARLKNLSIVVMDGPFMSLDPYGNSGSHLMGHVVHAIHNANVGRQPMIPSELLDYVNKKSVASRMASHFDKFVEATKKYIPAIEQADYQHSLFTIRAVLPNVDATDERPTVVSRSEENIIDVFSGKLITCVESAFEVRRILDSSKGSRSAQAQIIN